MAVVCDFEAVYWLPVLVPKAMRLTKQTTHVQPALACFPSSPSGHSAQEVAVANLTECENQMDLYGYSLFQASLLDFIGQNVDG